MNLLGIYRFTLLSLASVLLLAQQVSAGSAEVTGSDGNTMRFEYRGDDLRINMGEDDSAYMILSGENIYVVSNSDGNLMVIDVNQAMGMFGSMAGAAAPSMVATEVISLTATGNSEKHAGMSGEVYELRYRTDDGKEHETELVLTNDARARAFRDAMYKFATTMAKSVGQASAADRNSMQAELASIDKGVLRYGEDMTVTALSDDKIAAARFVLPAEPKDLSSLGSILGAGNTSSGGSSLGGVFSGIFGSKQPQEEGKEEAAADEAGEDPSEAEQVSPSKEIGKALGRLFGK